MTAKNATLAASITTIVSVSKTTRTLGPIILNSHVVLGNPVAVSGLQVGLPRLARARIVGHTFIASNNALDRLTRLPAPRQMPKNVPSNALIFSGAPACTIHLFAHRNRPCLGLFGHDANHRRLGNKQTITVSSMSKIICDCNNSDIRNQPTIHLSITGGNRRALRIGGRVRAGLATIVNAIACQPHVTLPPGTIIRIDLISIDQTSTPTVALTNRDVMANNHRIPVPFRLICGPSDVSRQCSCTIRTHVVISNRLQFVGADHITILARNRPDRIRIIMSPIHWDPLPQPNLRTQ